MHPWVALGSLAVLSTQSLPTTYFSSLLMRRETIRSSYRVSMSCEHRGFAEVVNTVKHFSYRRKGQHAHAAAGRRTEPGGGAHCSPGPRPPQVTRAASRAVGSPEAGRVPTDFLTTRGDAFTLAIAPPAANQNTRLVCR